jgi:hypothetical protein
VVLLPAVIHQIKDKDRLFSVSGPDPDRELEPEQKKEKENV